MASEGHLGLHEPPESDARLSVGSACRTDSTFWQIIGFPVEVDRAYWRVRSTSTCTAWVPGERETGQLKAQSARPPADRNSAGSPPDVKGLLARSVQVAQQVLIKPAVAASHAALSMCPDTLFADCEVEIF